jgi:hypothetical protein
MYMDTASLNHAALTWSAAVSLGLDAKSLSFDASSGNILDRYQRPIDFSKLKGFVEDAMKASHLFDGETSLKYSKAEGEFIFSEKEPSSGDLMLMMSGPTSTIATMRALVLKKTGYRVDVPDAIAFASVKQEVMSSRQNISVEQKNGDDYVSPDDKNLYSMTSSDFIRLAEYKELVRTDPSKAFALLKDAQEKQRPHLAAAMKKHKDLERELESSSVGLAEDDADSDQGRMRQRVF